jgi:hypothetical protein
VTGQSSKRSASAAENLPSVWKLPEWAVVVPLLLGLVAWLAGLIWAPSQAGTEFYAACAQVIPVLLLALAIEVRLLRIDVPEGSGIRALGNAVDEELEHLREREAQLLAEDADREEALAEQKAIGRLEYQFQLLRRVHPRLTTAYIVMRAIYVMAAAAVLLLGEVRALDALTMDSAAEADARIPFSAVLFGFVAVLVGALMHPLQRR